MKLLQVSARERPLIWTLLFFIFVCQAAQGQNGVTYVYLDNPHNDFIDYLINSGKFKPRFVFHQPFEFDSTLTVSDDSRAGAYFVQFWQRFYGKKEFSAQATFADKVVTDGVSTNRGKFVTGAHFVTSGVTLANRSLIDEDFKYDPLYAGDLSEAANWIFGRVNDAYLNLRYKTLDLFLGRINRNWGAPGTPGLILSSNPYSYDHLLFSFTGRSVKFSLIFGQLEDVDGQSIKNIEKPDSITFSGNSRKFLVGHRLDFRPTNRLQIALSEMATYGGPGRDIEFVFFNPTNFYYALQRNDRKQLDGFWSLDVFYKFRNAASLYGQFLIDDIIVNNDPGVDDRERFPDRFGVMLSLRGADWFFPSLNSEITYVRIWNRTYQSKRSWENYHYRGLGLGYPCASCEEVKFKFAYWKLFPWMIQNETIVGRYGSVQLTDLFPLRKEKFPIGPVTHNFINSLTIRYFPSKSINAWARIQYLKEPNHYSNRIFKADRFVLFFGAEVTLSTSARAK